MSLRSDFVADPPSQAIMTRLDAVGARACEHGRNPCNQYCGVERRDGAWRVIPFEQRLAWLERVAREVENAAMSSRTSPPKRTPP